MNNYEIGNTKDMMKKYNRSSYLLNLHQASTHPSFRFFCETVGADNLCNYLLKAHEVSNRLAAYFADHDRVRYLRLELITTIKIDQMTFAHETRFFLETEYNAALEELLNTIPGNKTEHIIGVDPKAEHLYNLTIAVSFEEI